MQDCTRVKHYTPESQLRHPRKLFQAMCQDLMDSRSLAWRLMVRDIKAQYRQSAFGILWSLAPPAVMALVLTLAKNSRVINIGHVDFPYPAYVILSVALWQTFTESLLGPVKAVGSGKGLLTRINFPREALVMAKLGETAFNLAIKLILIAATFLIFGIHPTLCVLLAPAPLLLLILFGTSVGMIIAPLASLYNDFSRALTIATAFWLFFTPVLYTLPDTGLFSLLVSLNPVTPLLVTTREMATTGVLSMEASFWLAASLTPPLALFSWILFRLSLPFVVERSGA